MNLKVTVAIILLEPGGLTVQVVQSSWAGTETELGNKLQMMNIIKVTEQITPVRTRIQIPNRYQGILLQIFCHRYSAKDILPQIFCFNYFGTNILPWVFFYQNVALETGDILKYDAAMQFIPTCRYSPVRSFSLLFQFFDIIQQFSFPGNQQLLIHNNSNTNKTWSLVAKLK